MLARQRRYLLVWSGHPKFARIPGVTDANTNPYRNPHSHFDADSDKYQHTYNHGDSYNVTEPDANSNTPSKTWREREY